MEPWLTSKGTAIAISVLVALRRPRRQRLFGYGIAFLIVGLASALQWLLREQYAGAPFLIIYPAVIIATLVGGLGPGLFSAVLAGASQFGLFIPGFHWLALCSYAFDATVCVSLIVVINRTLDLLLANVEREKHEKQHQLVVAGELHHRIQNLLTVIYALIRFSVPATGSIPAHEIREQLLGRVQSMAAANRAITNSAGQGVRLIDLIRNEVQGFEGRVEVSDTSQAALSSQMTQNFSLIIHELLTNAVKHGALSVPEGRVSVQVRWDARLLTFIWEERQAPAPKDKAGSGFGSLLLGGFAKSFCQSVDASYRPEGLRYVLKIESDEIKGPQDRQLPVAAE